MEEDRTISNNVLQTLQTYLMILISPIMIMFNFQMLKIQINLNYILFQRF
jgi:hypothetical protein